MPSYILTLYNYYKCKCSRINTLINVSIYFCYASICREVDNYYDPGYRVCKYYLAMLGLAKRGSINATVSLCSRKFEDCVPEVMSLQKIYRINETKWPLGCGGCNHLEDFKLQSMCEFYKMPELIDTHIAISNYISR